MATQYVLCNNIDLSFWIRPLGIGTEYATHVYLPEVAGMGKVDRDWRAALVVEVM